MPDSEEIIDVLDESSDIERSQEAYRELSGIASTVARQLALAAIAVIWLFHVSREGAFALDASFQWPLVLVLLSLAADLLQYVAGAFMHGAYARLRELGRPPKMKDGTSPPWLNWPAVSLFWLKMGLLIFGYILLLRVIPVSFDPPPSSAQPTTLTAE